MHRRRWEEVGGGRGQEKTTGNGRGDEREGDTSHKTVMRSRGLTAGKEGMNGGRQGEKQNRGRTKMTEVWEERGRDLKITKWRWNKWRRKRKRANNRERLSVRTGGGEDGEDWRTSTVEELSRWRSPPPQRPSAQTQTDPVVREKQRKVLKHTSEPQLGISAPDGYVLWSETFVQHLVRGIFSGILKTFWGVFHRKTACGDPKNCK